MQDLQRQNLRALNQKEAQRLEQQLTAMPPPTSAIYLGYDSDRHLHEVKTSDGSTYWAVSDSSGAPEKGAIVELFLTRGGTPRIDFMPR